MRVFLVVLCLSGSLANSGLLCAQTSENVSGVLHMIDVKTGVITIRPGKLGDKEAMSYSLHKPDIQVVTVQGRVRLTDLAFGNIVHLHLNDRNEVDAVRAELPFVRAALTAIDLPKHTIRVLAEDFKDKELKVTKETKISHLGKDRALADLKVYQWLEITASLDGKFALTIEAHAPGTRNGRVSSGRLEGRIILLDVTTGTLLFHHTKGRERLVTFAVPNDLSYWHLFDGRPIDKLPGPLPIASKPATIYLSQDRTQVKRILAKAPLVRCLVNAVDIANRKLTVNENGATKIWEIPADVKVMDGRRKGKVEDLRVGTPVDLVLSLDRTRLRAVVRANPQ